MPPLFLPTHVENQAAMAKYMRNQFEFLGVRSPERRRLTRPIIRESRQLNLPTLQTWLSYYYQQPYREYQYVAIDLAFANVKRLTPDQYAWCREQTTNQAWWDSVDAWRKVLATYIFEHDALQTLGSDLLNAPDVWLRRVSLTLQLGRKVATNQAYLRQAIQLNATDHEFFIQKAIGWALRDYAKTNAGWVQWVLTTVPVSDLAQREALKANKNTPSA